MNSCSFIGNMGKPAETRQVGDTSVTSFSLGCSERWTDKGGQKQERTEWVSCQCWGARGEALAKYTDKGSKLYVIGSMETKKYQAQDGSDRYATSIKVKDFEFLSSHQSNNQDGYTPPSDSGRDSLPF